MRRRHSDPGGLGPLRRTGCGGRFLHAVAVRPQWGGTRGGGWPGCGVGTRRAAAPPGRDGCWPRSGRWRQYRGETALRFFSVRRGTLRKPRNDDPTRSLINGLRPRSPQPACGRTSRLPHAPPPASLSPENSVSSSSAPLEHGVIWATRSPSDFPRSCRRRRPASVLPWRRMRRVAPGHARFTYSRV